MTLPNVVHLIGIGGTGLSAIARVLLERGCSVTGSDRVLSPLAESLEADGARIMIGHHPDNIIGADLIVRSSAITDDNVEVRAALEAHIPVLKRAEFLSQLISGKHGIAVAGTHGKTTTTAMIAWMLSDLGLDPSYIIGGVSKNLGSNAHAGQGQYFVIEADEFDRMFLGLNPEIAIITNIEHDHPDCYPTAEEYYEAFLEFCRKLPIHSKLFICGDDPGGRHLLQEASIRHQHVFSYGLGSLLPDDAEVSLDYKASNLTVNEFGGFTFDAISNLALGFELCPAIQLQVPGVYNVNNALAALAVAHQLGLPLTNAIQALSDYQGTGRRFEVRGEYKGISVIDDYAHHPTEIRVTLAAARQRYPGRRLWVLWQPHTYSRTRIFFNEFVQAFAQADQVIVTEVYPSRELLPTDGYSSIQVVMAMSHPGKHYASSLSDATKYLLDNLSAGDVLLVFSAGDADQISNQVLDGLRRMEESHANE